MRKGRQQAWWRRQAGGGGRRRAACRAEIYGSASGKRCIQGRTMLQHCRLIASAQGVLVLMALCRDC